jgi:hypothetical protein
MQHARCGLELLKTLVDEATSTKPPSKKGNAKALPKKSTKKGQFWESGTGYGGSAKAGLSAADKKKLNCKNFTTSNQKGNSSTQEI